MKILLIHNYYQYWGGEDTYITALKKLLEENGHETYLYSKESKNIKTLWDKIKVFLGLFYNPTVEKELSAIIKKFKPDVAQFQNVFPMISPVAYIICKKFNIPIIQRVSNYRFVCPKGIPYRKGKICELCIRKQFPYPSIMFGCYHCSKLGSLAMTLSLFFYKKKGIIKIIDLYIFPTEFIKKYCLQLLSIPEIKAKVVASFFKNNEEKKRNKSIKEKNYVLYVGRLFEEKGILFLLNTFKDLPEVTLIVIGDGPLKRKVNVFSKYKNTILKGKMPKTEAFQYMRKATFMIVPSLCYDVFPNVILESFAVGTPIILPKTENFKGIIKNNITGVYYQPNNKKDLAQKVNKTLKNKDLIRKMKRNIMNQNKKKSSIIHLDQIIKLYFGLLTRRTN